MFLFSKTIGTITFIFGNSNKKLVCLNIRTNYEDSDQPQ